METLLANYTTISENEATHWFKVAAVEDIPLNGGACIKYKNKQIAVFHFARRDKWYACQNLCPHKMEMVLSRGMIGDEKGTPKVACPLHKHSFSLETGENLTGDLPAIALFPVKISAGFVYIGFSD